MNSSDIYDRVSKAIRPYISSRNTAANRSDLAKAIAGTLSTTSTPVSVTLVTRFRRFPKSVVGRRIANGACPPSRTTVRFKAVCQRALVTPAIQLNFTIHP